MPAPKQPLTLSEILLRILVITTRMIRDVEVHASTTTILKNLLGACIAIKRFGRVIRLIVLLRERIAIYGLAPLPPARPRPQRPTTQEEAEAQYYLIPKRAPRKPQPVRFTPGNGDDAFVRRDIHIVVAAIIKELHLGADAVGVSLPEQLQTLCLMAAIAATPLKIHPVDPPPPTQPRRTLTQPPVPAPPKPPKTPTSPQRTNTTKAPPPPPPKP